MAEARILPLKYNSYDLSFSDWVSLFTLALAPLAIHVIAGAPEPCYLSSTRPQWHDHLAHYNPTSILWRYAAIADRRIRARVWTPADMAATNAIFWTSQGWNGSEEMIDTSRPYSMRLPRKSRVNMFSREMAKTVIVTIQGAQAAAAFMGAYSNTLKTPISLGLDFIFYPVALFGLFRLVAAPWLTDDILYIYPSVRKISTDGPTEVVVIHELPSDGIRPVRCWRSRIFRTIFLLGLAGVWGLSLKSATKQLTGAVNTTTTIALNFVYFWFITATVFITTFYFARGCTTSTIIPCISTVWYKMYTVMIAMLALGLIVIACIETRKAPCGRYTTVPGELGDRLVCWSKTTTLVSLGTGSGNFGIASTMAGNRTSQASGFRIFNVTASCIVESQGTEWDSFSIYACNSLEMASGSLNRTSPSSASMEIR